MGNRRLLALLPLLLLSLGAAPAPLNVKDLGAKADGTTNDAAAIQKAIDQASAAGGGIVRLDSGTFLSGPIYLKSNVTLQIDKPATLKGTQNPADYPLIDTRWEGLERKMPASLVNAVDATNIALAGEGTVDGSGEFWWKKVNNSREDRELRPRLVEFLRCQKVRVEGVTLKDSPNWMLHPIYCKDVTIRGVTITAPRGSTNTDGIDPDSCDGMLITGCTIACGDDCIAVKSGKNEDGRRVGKPMQNLVIADCTMLHGLAGVALGSEMSGGIKNVTIRNCKFIGTARGIRLKTTRGRGGAMEDITVSDITMKDVGLALEITMRYSDVATPKVKDGKYPVDEKTPAVRNIRFRNIQGTGIKDAGTLIGLPESKITDLILEKIDLACQKGLLIRDARKVKLDQVDIKAAKGAPLTQEQVE